MLRRSGAVVAVLALLYGFSAAPFTHAHHAIDSVSDEHHPQGEALVHSHASPHAHDSERGPADTKDGDDQIWSVDSFVFQAAAAPAAPAPVLLAFAEPHLSLTGTWLGIERPQPIAHGPPVGTPFGLRAPPASLPSLA